MREMAKDPRQPPPARHTKWVWFCELIERQEGIPKGAIWIA